MTCAFFRDADAAAVASWARDPRDAFWVAPSSAPPITADTVRTWVRKAATALVLRENGRVVAYGELNPLESQKRSWWVGHMLVDPTVRGRGLCRQLTRSLLRHAFEIERAREVLLIVFPQNAGARRAYEACGFRECGHEHDYYAPYDCTVRMVRMRVTRRTVRYE